MQQTGSASTEDGLPFARNWLKQCMQEHKSCGLSNPRRCPSRLLDVDCDQVCLRTSGEFLSCPQYATLSHCWSTLEFTTLKKHNLKAFQQSIPAEALTKTFPDAVQVTRYLGFQYIWQEISKSKKCKGARAMPIYSLCKQT